MKKKLLNILLLFLLIIPVGGCFEGDNKKSNKITTTVYPIEYIINRIDPKEETVSIYPNGTNTDEYKLTNKQIDEFAKSTSLFIYNGLTKEKEIARKLVNKNKKMQIIDVTFGLKFHNSIEELWLSPSNYLMLCNTVKNDLIEINNNKYKATDIENNYHIIEEELSILDANLKAIADNAEENKKTLVIADKSISFLADYGFDIVDISDKKEMPDNIKEKFKNKTYTNIYAKANEDLMDSVKDLVDNYGAKVTYVNTMNTLTDSEKQSNENYLTIMNRFISDLSNNVLN